MRIPTGTRLGPYEIVEPIGAGGMGQVYRARDGRTASIVGKWQVSTDGGEQPVWRADGKEIYYLAADGQMMAVPVESGENFFRPGEPKPLFQTGWIAIQRHANTTSVPTASASC
jgi:serine/threonine protein kinase